MLVNWTDEKAFKVTRQDNYAWYRPYRSTHSNKEVTMLINQSKEPLATKNKEKENQYWGTT